MTFKSPYKNGLFPLHPYDLFHTNTYVYCFETPHRRYTTLIHEYISSYEMVVYAYVAKGIYELQKNLIFDRKLSYSRLDGMRKYIVPYSKTKQKISFRGVNFLSQMNFFTEYSIRYDLIDVYSCRCRFYRYEIREMIQKIKILQSEQRNNAECQDTPFPGSQKFQQIRRYDHNGSVMGVAQPLLERHDMDEGKLIDILTKGRID